MTKYFINLFFLIPIFCLSQSNITISGYVQEAESGEKLIGGTVYDLNSNKGTITNDYGFYSLTLPKDSIRLRISYIGYQTQIFETFLESDISKIFYLKDQMLK